MAKTIPKAIICVGVLIASFNANAQDETSPPKTGIPSENYTVGKPTQTVKPREMKETIRPDGSRSIITGQTRDANGKITGPHSHAVVRNGEVESSRTAGMPTKPKGTTLPKVGVGETLGRSFPVDARGTERSGGIGIGGGAAGGKKQTKQTD